jgi:Holliday junction DNA helicase RuvB
MVPPSLYHRLSSSINTYDIIRLMPEDKTPPARMISPKPGNDDAALDTNLRPRRLSDFIESLDHVLIYGPPGLGKTTLAHIIAADLGVSIKISSGPAIERPGDLAAILTNLQKDDVLFIDEIHRLSRVVEEVLYPAMEDFALDIMIGKGPGARSLRLTLPRFTLVGATTRFAMVSSPLRDRFGNVYRLDFYNQEAIATILKRSAKILKIEVEDDSFNHIACRARGTPRVANRLLKRIRDYAQVTSNGVVTQPMAIEALSRLEIDAVGLDDIDHKVLQTIIEKFSGGPVGLETIAASISEEADTIMDVYEPYLLQLGFIERTPRGRMATRLAYEHLGIPYKEKQGNQPALW